MTLRQLIVFVCLYFSYVSCQWVQKLDDGSVSSTGPVAGITGSVHSKLDDSSYWSTGPAVGSVGTVQSKTDDASFKSTGSLGGGIANTQVQAKWDDRSFSAAGSAGGGIVHGQVQAKWDDSSFFSAGSAGGSVPNIGMGNAAYWNPVNVQWTFVPLYPIQVYPQQATYHKWDDGSRVHVTGVSSAVNKNLQPVKD